MKTPIIQIVLALMFLGAFNVVFYLLNGVENPISVWISYGFIHLAFFTLVLIPCFKVKGKDSFYLNTSLYLQAICYFVIELIAGSLFIAYCRDNMLWPLIVQSALWLAYMIIILANVGANHHIADSLASRQQVISACQKNRMELKKLLLRIEDSELNRIVSGCYNNLTISSTRATEISNEIDANIEQCIELLKQALSDGNHIEAMTLASRLHKMIIERKSILKYSY